MMIIEVGVLILSQTVNIHTSNFFWHSECCSPCKSLQLLILQPASQCVHIILRYCFSFFYLHFSGLGRGMSENKLCFDFSSFVFLNQCFFKSLQKSNVCSFFLFPFYLYWFPNLYPPALISPLMGSLCCFSYKVNTFFIFASELCSYTSLRYF